MLLTLDPGLQATLQDLGRPGHAALGVACSGAADVLSLAVVNRLVGNPDGAGALELTLTGGAWRFNQPAVFALSGARMAAHLEHPEGRRDVVGWHAAHAAPAGSVLRLGAAEFGARAYLGLAGGFVAEPVLGSVSTQVAVGLGGTNGRPLQRGDALAWGAAAHSAAPRVLAAAASAEVQGWLRVPSLRATDGSHAGLFDPAGRAAFWEATFVVSTHIDRMGARLVGPAIQPPAAGHLTTEGLPVGAVEIPAPHAAIALLADAPPTGGYPVLACVAAVDLPRLGQLRPHERVRFERVDVAHARTEFLRRRARLDALLAPACLLAPA